MAPQWFDVSAIPFSRMWADDAHWYPHLLCDARFRAHFLFRGQEECVSQKIELMSEQECRDMEQQDMQEQSSSTSASASA